MTCFINLQQKDKSRFIMPDLIKMYLFNFHNMVKQSKIPEYHLSSWIAIYICLSLVLAAFVSWSHDMLLLLWFLKTELAELPVSWCLHLYQEIAPLYIPSASSNSTFQSTGPIYSLHFVLAEISRNCYQYLDKTQSFKQCSKQDPKREKRSSNFLASCP